MVVTGKYTPGLNMIWGGPALIRDYNKRFTQVDITKRGMPGASLNTREPKELYILELKH